MRILVTTRGSSGHLLPLAPFAHACLRAGHEVKVAAQHQHRANIERAQLELAPVGDPPAEEWMPLMGEFGEKSMDEANALMIGEFFARIDTDAALPALREIVESWQPALIVRESWEFASTLIAESHRIPLARVGLGLAGVEEMSVGLAAPAVDRARARLDLPADPAGDRLRETPYLTTMPQQLEDPAARLPAVTHRFRHDAPEASAGLPDWWPGNHDPLVYLTLGSVTAEPHLPYFPQLYRDVIERLAPLPIRLLVTIGNTRDPDELSPLPGNVRVERWVPQDDVAPHAAAFVCHGGYGSTLGALAHGVPLVVLPLFSTDQWANAAAAARAGAGVALDAEQGTRQVLGLPNAATLDGLGPGVRRVIEDGSHRREARRLADAMQALPPVDAAVDVLVALSERREKEKELEMDFETLIYDAGDAIATITLNRPERLNTIVPPLPDELEAAVHLAVADRAVRVIVLRGAGRAFCAGFDFGGGFHHWDEALTTDGAWDPGKDFVGATAPSLGAVPKFMSLWRAPKPVISQVHGWCLGGGSELALCADLVIASEDASIGTPYSRMWGCHLTGMWIYRLGLAKAKEHALTGRPLSGLEAADAGLINLAVPFERLDAEVREQARRLAGIPPSQLAAMKLVVNQAYENMGLASTQLLGPILDGLMRNTPEAKRFVELAEREGVPAAVTERDGPFADYSQASPADKPDPSNSVQP